MIFWNIEVELPINTRSRSNTANSPFALPNEGVCWCGSKTRRSSDYLDMVVPLSGTWDCWISWCWPQVPNCNRVSEHGYPENRPIRLVFLMGHTKGQNHLILPPSKLVATLGGWLMALFIQLFFFEIHSTLSTCD